MIKLILLLLFPLALPAQQKFCREIETTNHNLYLVETKAVSETDSLYIFTQLGGEQINLAKNQLQSQQIVEIYRKNNRFQLRDKSPLLSGFFSTFISGTGQLYNGQYTKALLMAGLTYSAAWYFFRNFNVMSGNSNQSSATSNISGLVLLGTYAWSITDAVGSAREINKELTIKYREVLDRLPADF